MKQQQPSLMSQIHDAKKEAQRLREFMKDAAQVATLTYPSLPQGRTEATAGKKAKSRD